jgi:hypothetical protein
VNVVKVVMVPTRSREKIKEKKKVEMPKSET